MKNTFLAIIFLLSFLFLPSLLSKSKIVNHRIFEHTFKFCGKIYFVGDRYMVRGAMWNGKSSTHSVLDLSNGDVSKTFLLPMFVDDSEKVLKYIKGDSLCLIYGINSSGSNELIRLV